MVFVIVSESFLVLREGETPWNDAEHLWVDSRAYLDQAVECVLVCETLYPWDTIRHLPRVLQLFQHYNDQS
jgi:hypothetical protein